MTLLFYGCNQKDSKLKIKSSDKVLLSAEINLNNKVERIIDSSFKIKNNDTSLVKVANYLIQKNAIKSISIKSYLKDNVLASNTSSTYDNTGNISESIFSSKNRKTIVKYDEYGNSTLTHSFNENDKLQTELKYNNTYDNSNLIKIEKLDKDGLIFETVEFKYDSSDNLIKKTTKGSSNMMNKEVFSYNKNNQKTKSIFFSSNSLQDSTLYYYDKDLLSKIETYSRNFKDEFDKNPSKIIYTYDEIDRLIEVKHIASFGSISRYYQYQYFDSMKNWYEKGNYDSAGNLIYLIKRKIILNKL